MAADRPLAQRQAHEYGSLAAAKRPGDLDVAILYLNARDPQAPECYRHFREQGFVFTGCLPGGADGDYLLLQHLNGRPFDREGSVLLPNYADMIERLYQVNSI